MQVLSSDVTWLDASVSGSVPWLDTQVPHHTTVTCQARYLGRSWQHQCTTHNCSICRMRVVMLIIMALTGSAGQYLKIFYTYPSWGVQLDISAIAYSLYSIHLNHGLYPSIQ